jgi:hypothetical protein
LLARLVFEGKVDRSSTARLPGGTTEQSLEQSLGSGHCEALTGELHQRLRRICAMDSSAVDVQELCTQAERLCQWRWPNSPATARFFWAAAAQRLWAASKRIGYVPFLLLPGESHLRGGADNRGVLRLAWTA